MSKNVLFGHKLVLECVLGKPWPHHDATSDALLCALRDGGIDFIELPLRDDAHTDELARAAAFCRERGLAVTVHTYCQENEYEFGVFDVEKHGPLHSDLFAAISSIASEGEGQMPLIFHEGKAGCAPDFPSYDQAVACAKNFFLWVRDQIDRNYQNMLPVCEIALPFGPDKPDSVRLGDTFESCLDIVASTDIGLCWDMGHSFRSTQLGKTPLLPDQDFTQRVVHVHAHNAFMKEDGGYNDHVPLEIDDGIVPWRQFFAHLGSHGFAGRVLFELSPQNWPDVTAMARAAQQNIAAIRGILADSASAR